MAFRLSSNAFADGEWIPELHSCQGADVSPSLEWSGEPGETRSFTLISEDPDAPAGTWTHWLLYDIPAKVHDLAQGYKPGALGLSGSNDFGDQGYGGPCPPKGHGPHHYFFKLYALDVDRLDLRPNPKVEEVESEAHRHAIAQGELIGTYERR
jgi:Raf kinase inhibitor-like YbhB/YbcL family protein